MSASCERYEIELSALLDRELGPEAALLAVDHLVECPSCRAFWSAARGLEDALDELRGERTADLPPEMWDRIRSAASAGEEGPGPRATAPARPWYASWAVRAAAAVVAAVGVTALVLPRLMPAGTPAPTFEVGVAEARARMGEDRLLEVAGELLRADPRDRAALVDILEAVERRQRRREGSVDRTAGGERVETAAGDESRAGETPRYATY